ncbi:alpha/beta hydrolase [Carbonactinospora thermoautotrophica]|uniref:alpha/beta fold hydrolase n=1 Tax=Carbonactinospora thermoautotrophica TaxID=1469144 RepID=UPI0022721FD3|nr:alpha/beta hydrolase [Carbonactinospora thermoautotrophica]MCX9190475.1 alpha/beta hydrolase [Carbonactinospora thermoautotrophica]
MTVWEKVGKRAGAFGLAVSAVAAGAAIGLAAERYAIGRSFRRDQRAKSEPFGLLRGEPQYVTAEDGVQLYVEVEEPEQAESPVTLVFSHGYVLNQDSWHYQRKEFRQRFRCVFWDQRGHGRSWRGAPETANIDQLGRDLRAVLEATAPDGPVVLIGHSMGGMTVMALADQYPELFGDRVLGVGLVSTSAGRLADVTLGIPAYTAKIVRRLAPRLMETLRRQAELIERGRRASSDLSYVLTKRYSFASDVPPALVEFAAEIIESTPIDVVADFYPAFDSHDKLRALPVLQRTETLVLVGERDLLTPVEHSAAIVDAVPGAELVIVPHGGHLVMLEHPEVVNRHIVELVERCARYLAAERKSRRDRRADGTTMSEGPAA